MRSNSKTRILLSAAFALFGAAYLVGPSALADGTAALATMCEPPQPLSPWGDSHCPYGGTRHYCGIDKNHDGRLQAEERVGPPIYECTGGNSNGQGNRNIFEWHFNIGAADPRPGQQTLDQGIATSTSLDGSGLGSPALAPAAKPALRTSGGA
jgi:hypothetical protein